MKTFKELYLELLAETINNNDESYIHQLEDFDPHHLDCLLHPEKYPLTWNTDLCICSSEEKHCTSVCPFHARSANGDGIIDVDQDLCAGCSTCIKECKASHLTQSKDIFPALKAIRTHKAPVYALVAPAFLGQFSSEVTPGKLRTALKTVGFDGMIEVALFADILTLKEALEFDDKIRDESDFQLTSCCCPVWIAMIRKIYHDLVPHVPPSVSPMIAAGRAVKYMHPDCLTVFIGPCLAKKAEAKEKDIAGAVDFVLTFQEVHEIFEAMEINPVQMEESEKDHSSRAGRIYAFAGGVSEAVSQTIHRITPNRTIDIRTQNASGVPACRAMIKEISEGNITANFYEGMGCVGGCVGGPRAMIPHEQGKVNVLEYGDNATYPTPIDNPYVIELLEQLGFETIESLIHESDILTRPL